jgi:hypothetical protein
LFIVQLRVYIFFLRFVLSNILYLTTPNHKRQTTNILLLPKILNIGAEYFHRNG